MKKTLTLTYFYFLIICLKNLSFCLDWNPPQTKVLSIKTYTNVTDINKSFLKQSKDYVGLLSNNGTLRIYKKQNLDEMREFHNITDFDFIYETNQVVAIVVQEILQLWDLNIAGQNVSIAQTKKKLLNNISGLQKILVNQNSIIILCKNNQILRIKRSIAIKYKLNHMTIQLHNFTVKWQQTFCTYQTFIHLSSQTIPTPQQQKYIKQQYWLNNVSEYEYVIVRRHSQIIVFRCNVSDYKEQCKISLNINNSLILNSIDIDYKGQNWMIQFQKGLNFYVWKYSFNNNSNNDSNNISYEEILAIYSNVQIYKSWVMDYQSTRNLVLLKNGSLIVYSYGNETQQTWVALTKYQLTKGNNVTNAIYDIRGQKLTYSFDQLITTIYFNCTDQNSFYQSVVSCFYECEQNCINCNYITGKCLDILIINETTVQQPVQSETLDEDLIYLNEKQAEALNMMSESINQVNQGATYAIWSFSALPLSAFFMGFINFWNICSFYGFLGIDMPIFLRKILTRIFTMLNSSLLEFIGLQYSQCVSIRGQLIKQKLQENIVKDYQISSDFSLMNGQNFIVYLCGIVLTIFIHLGYKAWTKVFKEKNEKQSFYSFFLLYFGQTVSLFPCIMIGFWMLKGSSTFSNGSEKLNIVLYHFSICIIFLIPFLVLCYIEIKHCHEYKKAKRRQAQRAFQAKVQILKTPKLKTRAFRLHKKLEWFYLTQCNVLIPMAALVAYPNLSLVICFGLFGLNLYLSVKNKNSGILRKINQVILSLQLIILNCLFLGIKIAGEYGMNQLRTRLAFGCIILIAIGTIHQVLSLIIVIILIDKIFYLFQKIRKSCCQFKFINSKCRFKKTLNNTKQNKNLDKPTNFQQQTVFNGKNKNFRQIIKSKFFKATTNQNQETNFYQKKNILNNKVIPLDSKKAPRTLRNMKANLDKMKIIELSLKKEQPEKDIDVSYILKRRCQKSKQSRFRKNN